MKVLILILIFLIVGSLLIIENNNLKISNSKDAKIFYNLFLGWINNIYLNFQTITGDVVNMRWFDNQ